MSEHYQKNKSRILKRNHDHYLANKERISETVKKWRHKNSEKVRGYLKKYSDENREECRRACREWYHRNIESERKRARIKNAISYKQNRDSILESNRKWARKNQSKKLAITHKRRALKLAATVNLAQITEWMAFSRSRKYSTCYYCQRRISSKKIHFDHIIALSKGGSHSVDNLCVSCPSCNLSKQNKDVVAWVRVGQQVLSL